MSDYRSVKAIANDPKYPFSEAMLRHYLLHRHKNGLESAVRRIGKRIFVRMDLFERWIEDQAKHDRVGTSRVLQ
jgi:hypothetical protein